MTKATVEKLTKGMDRGMRKVKYVTTKVEREENATQEVTCSLVLHDSIERRANVDNYMLKLLPPHHSYRAHVLYNVI